MRVEQYVNTQLLLICMLSLTFGMPAICKRRVVDAPVFDASVLGYTGKNIREINSFKTRFNRRIAIIRDGSGNKFIVKQDMRGEISRHLSVIRDVAAAEMAQVGNVPANKVVLIPAHYRFPGKALVHLPATLHTFAPGTMVKVLPKEQKREIYIHQSIKPNVAKEERGLNMKVIKSMASNRTLASIVACDTFTANGDRHHQNYFYNQKSDEYHAIDMESCFDKNLATYGCRLIRQLTRERKGVLTSKDVEGLKIYCSVLRRLLKAYTPETMYAELVALTTKSGLTMRRKNAGIITNYLNKYEVNIRKNYASCKRLVGLLDRLFKQYTMKRSKGG